MVFVYIIHNNTYTTNTCTLPYPSIIILYVCKNLDFSANTIKSLTHKLVTRGEGLVAADKPFKKCRENYGQNNRRSEI